MKKITFSLKGLWRGLLALMLAVSMLGAASVLCFAETTASEEATEETATTGITNVSVSLSEDIIVKFYTSATTGDGSKITVVFNSETYELTNNVDGLFEFVGVTPQNLGDEMTATFTDADGAQVGETKTVSVKSYLEGLLALSYEDSGCESQLQHQAMQELCVNMLNYGAAAQEYIEHDVENLANAGLTDEQKALATEKITVTDTDKAVNGSAWIGAGVRFDYRLGLYFVFTADSADEYTATINDKAVTPEAYTALGEGYYVIRYNSFNAVNMNDVVTAKLEKDGAEAQTFAYSIKSYVASKGGDDSAIANLVNATYTYGFAAVAYSAEYVTTDPTFEEAGSIAMDGKGYDFSESKYGTVILPKLDFENYTTTTVGNAADGYLVDQAITTTFTLKDDTVAYSKEFETDNCIKLEGVLYSEYDYKKIDIDDVTVSYDKTNGYTYDVADGKTVNLTVPPITYGADLTIMGNIIADGTGDEARWRFFGVDVTVGVAGVKDANITINSAIDQPFTVGTGMDSSGEMSVATNMLVSKGSTITVTKATKYGAYVGNSDTVSGSSLIIDGTVTLNARLRSANTPVIDAEAYEYGFDPAVYVRHGTLTVPGIQTYSLQVGSEQENASGTLIINGVQDKTFVVLQKTSGVTRMVFAKGSVEFKDKEAKTGGIVSNDINEAYIDIRSGITFTVSGALLDSAKAMFICGPSSEPKDGTVLSHQFYIQKDASFNFTDTDYSSKFLYLRYGTFNIYAWDELAADEYHITVDGAEKTVRVVNNIEKTVSSTQTLTKSDCTAFPVLAAGTAITSSTTTQEMGTLGTFVQGTYTDGDGAAQTVWYQIVD